MQRLSGYLRSLLQAQPFISHGGGVDNAETFLSLDKDFVRWHSDVIAILIVRPLNSQVKLFPSFHFSPNSKRSPNLSMENTSWEQKLHALTHILTDPTNSPPLHSQLFIATQIPCYLNWDYPPLLCRQSSAFFTPLTKWAFYQFLKKVRRFGIPETSWRSKCPYHLPPPLILANGVEEGGWGAEERRNYVRKRLRRKRLGSDINPVIPIIIPNLLLLSLLFWNPYSLD